MDLQSMALAMEIHADPHWGRGHSAQPGAVWGFGWGSFLGGTRRLTTSRDDNHVSGQAACWRHFRAPCHIPARSSLERQCLLSPCPEEKSEPRNVPSTSLSSDGENEARKGQEQLPLCASELSSMKCRSPALLAQPALTPGSPHTSLL